MPKLWGIIENALSYLEQQELIDRTTVAGIVTQSQLQSQGLGAQANQAMIDSLNNAVQEALVKGYGRDEWAKAARGIIGARISHEEAIGRTAVHRAYVAGQKAVLDSPAGKLFPYFQYQATRDTRVRPDHKAMDGKVYHKDSPMARKAAELLSAINCRCNQRPIRRKEAIRLGIDDDTGWVEPVPQKPAEPIPIGPSRARILRNPDLTEAQSVQPIHSILGKDRTPQDVASMVGAPDNATVRLEPTTSSKMFVYIDSPEIEAVREIKRVRGKLVIDNISLQAKTTGQGLGAKVLAQQVDQAKRLGVSKIQTTATRGEGYNGYYTWARLGYDGPIPDHVAKKLPRQLASAKNVSDLVRTKEGAAWWKQNGDTVALTFDLTPGSRSIRALNQYVKAKAANGQDVRKVVTASPVVAPLPVAPPSFGPSTARVKSRPAELTGLQEILGANATEQDVASAVGAPADAEVTYKVTKTLGGHPMITVKIKSKDVTADRRIMKFDDDVVVKNIEVRVKKPAQGKGIGTEILGRQVEQLKRIGVKRIEIEAARSRTQNGYYTWPRLGYDAPIPAAVQGKLPVSLSKATSISELMETPEGREWWKKHGVSVNMSFDLTPGSRSNRVLEAYLAEKQKQKKV